MLTATAKLPQSDFNVLWITLSGYRDIAQRVAVGFDDEGTRVAASKCWLIVDRLLSAIHPQAENCDGLFSTDQIAPNDASDMVRRLFVHHVECEQVVPLIPLVEGRYAMLYFAQFFLDLSNAWQFLDQGNFPQFVARLGKMQTRCFGEINFSNLLASRGLEATAVA